MMRFVGISLAAALTTSVVAGIAGTIALDFEPYWKPLIGPESAEEPSQVPRTGIFDEVESITFFVSKPIDGTDLKVTTGASFLTPEDIASRSAQEMWCYLNFGSDSAVHRRLDLGRQDGDSSPDFRELTDLSPDDIAEIGIDRLGLEALAQSHCRFDDFDPRDAES